MIRQQQRIQPQDQWTAVWTDGNPVVSEDINWMEYVNLYNSNGLSNSIEDILNQLKKSKKRNKIVSDSFKVNAKLFNKHCRKK